VSEAAGGPGGLEDETAATRFGDVIADFALPTAAQSIILPILLQ
jgi:hypothetical protein